MGNHETSLPTAFGKKHAAKSLSFPQSLPVLSRLPTPPQTLKTISEESEQQGNTSARRIHLGF